MRGELVPEISRAFVYFLYAGVQSTRSLRVQASLAVCDLLDLGAYDVGGVLRCQRFALGCDAYGFVPYTFEAVLLVKVQRAFDIVLIEVGNSFRKNTAMVLESRSVMCWCGLVGSRMPASRCKNCANERKPCMRFADAVPDGHLFLNC